MTEIVARPTTAQIIVTGAREHNLKNVSVAIPKRKITVFTGVSGSGKSSLVFDTIAAEAQRQLNETFAAFARNFLPNFGQPDLDAIENLSAPVVIDQKPLGGTSRSTVGTASDINPLLRLLFSRAGTPGVGGPNAFSFNDPQGMCGECKGLGVTTQLDLDRFLDHTKSLNGGALLHPDFRGPKSHGMIYTASGFFDNDKPLANYDPDEWDKLLHGEGKVKVDVGGTSYNMTFEGVMVKFARIYIHKDINAMSDRNREIFQSFVTGGRCPECDGSRLSELARSVAIEGHHLETLLAMEVVELRELLQAIVNPLARPICASIDQRLAHLTDIGLGYLSLDRTTSTLSGGESQRLKVVRHLNSSLTDMLYVLDEPSVGLHARDIGRLNELLRKLRDKGNTVLVVEHDREVMAIADHVVDIGPRAGADGGKIVFEGTFAELTAADTATGRSLNLRMPVKEDVRRPTGHLEVRNATKHNLQQVTVDIPTGVLTVVTGVAGSGKSTLITEVFLAHHPDAVVIDQASVSANRRSNAATYTGVMDDIRKTFAKATQANASLFSFNSKGACSGCQGLGVVYTDMAFLEEIKTVCDVCNGHRFTDEVLAKTVRGRSIADVLGMTVDEGIAFFTEHSILTMLNALADVGLDYLQLGQPLNTLSGGECQRLKLATELHKQSAIYVMDEPTTGLHMSDTSHLIGIMNRLVEAGNTVIVIEHDLDVVKNADWVIDLGPEAGSGGGSVVFQGPPGRLIRSSASITAEHLRRDLGIDADRGSPFQLVIDRLIAATPEEVFDAFTDPEAQKVWYQVPGEPEMIVETSIDLRVGGLWTSAWGYAPAEMYRESCIFQEIDRPHRIVMAASASTPDGEHLETIQEITFEAENGKTRMTVRQSGFPDKELRDYFATTAWAGALERVDAYVTRHDRY